MRPGPGQLTSELPMIGDDCFHLNSAAIEGFPQPILCGRRVLWSENVRVLTHFLSWFSRTLLLLASPNRYFPPRSSASEVTPIKSHFCSFRQKISTSRGYLLVQEIVSKTICYLGESIGASLRNISNMTAEYTIPGIQSKMRGKL